MLSWSGKISYFQWFKWRSHCVARLIQGFGNINEKPGPVYGTRPGKTAHGRSAMTQNLPAMLQRQLLNNQTRALRHLQHLMRHAP